MQVKTPNNEYLSTRRTLGNSVGLLVVTATQPRKMSKTWWSRKLSDENCSFVLGKKTEADSMSPMTAHNSQLDPHKMP